MATLGEAFIEVHADTKPFARELGPKLKAILDAADKAIKPSSRRTGEKISENISEGVDRKSGTIRKIFRKIGNFLGGEGKSWADKLKAPFERMAKGNFILTRIFGQIVVAAGAVTRRIFRLVTVVTKFAFALGELAGTFIQAAIQGLGSLIGISSDTAKTMSTLSTNAAKVGASFAAFAAELASFAPAAIAAAAAVVLLVGAVTALVAILAVALAPFATLTNLLLAAPAALTAIGVVIAPLIIGLHNLGDAFKAIFEKDPKKFAEDMKALSPVMKRLVNAVRPFRSEFDKIRDSVQEGLLGPIVKELGPSLRKLLPTLAAGFTAVATAMGKIGAEVLRTLTSGESLENLSQIFAAIAKFLSDHAADIGKLIVSLGMAATAALPMVLTLLDKFGAFMDRFATWILEAIQDGRFQQWLDRGMTALTNIWNLVKAIILMFAELFSQTDAGGETFLKKITNAVNKITKWMQSPEGKEGIKLMVSLAQMFADELIGALYWVKQILNTFVLIAKTISWINDHLPGGNKAAVKHNLGAVGKIGKFSGGGVVPNDQIAMVHKGEPILDPANSVARNRAILADAGMLGVLSPPAPIINVFVGNEQLDARTDYRIAKSNRVTARSLATGART